MKLTKNSRILFIISIIFISTLFIILNSNFTLGNAKLNEQCNDTTPCIDSLICKNEICIRKNSSSYSWDEIGKLFEAKAKNIAIKPLLTNISGDIKKINVKDSLIKVIGYQTAGGYWGTFLYYSIIGLLAWTILFFLYLLSNLIKGDDNKQKLSKNFIWVIIILLAIIVVGSGVSDLITKNFSSNAGKYIIYLIALSLTFLLFKKLKSSDTNIGLDNDTNLWLRIVAGSLWKIPAYAVTFGVLMTIPIINRVIGIITLVSLIDFFSQSANPFIIILKSITLAVMIGIIPQTIYSIMQFKQIAQAKYGYLQARRKGANINAIGTGLSGS